MTAPSTDERFRRLFEAHRDDIWRYCVRRLPSNEVEDAVADVFVVVWRRIYDLPSAESARPWLYGVARNTIRNRRRADRRRRRLSARLRSIGDEHAPSSESVVGRQADRWELTAAIDGLDPDDRELVRLRTWEELSLAEIAVATGRSERSVESRLARIRKQLARTITPSHDPAANDEATPRRRAPGTDHELWMSPTRRPGGTR